MDRAAIGPVNFNQNTHDNGSLKTMRVVVVVGLVEMTARNLHWRNPARHWQLLKQSMAKSLPKLPSNKVNLAEQCKLSKKLYVLSLLTGHLDMAAVH